MNELNVRSERKKKTNSELEDRFGETTRMHLQNRDGK